MGRAQGSAQQRGSLPWIILVATLLWLPAPTCERASSGPETTHRGSLTIGFGTSREQQEFLSRPYFPNSRLFIPWTLTAQGHDLEVRSLFFRLQDLDRDTVRSALSTVALYRVREGVEIDVNRDFLKWGKIVGETVGLVDLREVIRAGETRRYAIALQLSGRGREGMPIELRCREDDIEVRRRWQGEGVKKAAAITGGEDPEHGPVRVFPATGSWPLSSPRILAAATGRVNVSLGCDNPTAGGANDATSNVALLQFTLFETSDNENVSITSVTIQGAGTINEATEITSATVKLYEDGGTTKGSVDSSDTQLAAGSFSADNGNLTFSGSPLISLSKSTAKDYLVAVNLKDNIGGGKTAKVNIPSSSLSMNEEGERITIQSIAGTGATSGSSIGVFGPPLTGNAKTIAGEYFGTYVRSSVNTAGTFQDMAVSDDDGDGLKDLFITDSGSLNTILRFNLTSDGHFEAGASISSSATGPRGLLAADMDGDGDEDLILTTEESGGDGRVKVFLNNGDGTWTLNDTETTAKVLVKNLIATGNFCASGASGCTTDSDLDVIVGSGTGTHTVYTFSNNGSGNLTSVTSIDFVATLERIRLGDFNGDSKTDLMETQTPFGGFVRLFNGDGTGAFPALTTTVDSGGGITPSGLLTKDFTGDGSLDVLFLAAGLSPQELRLFPGNGDGTFGTKVTLPNVGSLESEIDAADFDGDGDQDLVVIGLGADVNQEQLRILKNNGTGTFTELSLPVPLMARQEQLAIADINGDSYSDVVISGGSGWSSDQVIHVAMARLVSSTLVVGTAIEGTVSGPQDMDIADVDGNGRNDLVVCGTSGIVVHLSNGSKSDVLAASTSVSSVNFSACSLTDVDGDSDKDIVACRADADSCTIFTNNGSGTFSAGNSFAKGTAGEAFEMLALNLNGDANIDLAVITSDTLTTFSGNGSTFSSLGTFTGCGASTNNDLVSADLDGDSDIDIAVTCLTQNSIAIFKNNGSGSMGSPTLVDSGTSDEPAGIDAADLDGDGDIDIAITNEGTASQSTTMAVFLNNGSGTFTKNDEDGAMFNRGGIKTETNLLDVEIADYDLDGDSDVIAADDRRGTLVVYLNNGSGSFTLQNGWVVSKGNDTNFAPGTVRVLAADLTGDSLREIVGLSGGSSSNQTTFLNRVGIIIGE